MQINGVRSALAYRFDQATTNHAPAQKLTPARTQPGQDKGIIIVSGKTKAPAQDRASIVGGKPHSSLEERGIIIVGGKPESRVATQNGILFVGGRSVIR